MATNFLLTKLSEDEFFNYARYENMGDAFMEIWRPRFYEWLKQNEIRYQVHFEYGAPCVLAGSIRVRLEVESDEDAVLLRLAWS